ncbi:hypothetical protein [Pyxidicoccus trucidator]|uniref:hypothetical protein n=1 Tax=Pyxidicoccus trucidator TaxID=2709662 RepID=UPI0013DB0957|nr:hypothetical protein [Pyxidicoccus trucidator]
MQARNFIGSALLAAGMLVSGGAAAAEASEPGHLALSEEALPDRTVQDFEYTYYSDPSMTDVIGGQGRSSGSWFRWGTTSSYYDYTSGPFY